MTSTNKVDAAIDEPLESGVPQVGRWLWSDVFFGVLWLRVLLVFFKGVCVRG